MKTNTKFGLALMAPLLFMAPTMGSAAALTVQTEANASNASAGEAGADIGSSALISVVVNNAATGAPVSNLGATVGDGISEITLPAGWTLFSNLNVPPGGCLLTPTQFYNWGNGSYNIRVVPFLGNPACSWSTGNYHYVVGIQTGAGRGVVKGSGLGVLSVP